MRSKEHNRITNSPMFWTIKAKNAMLWVIKKKNCWNINLFFSVVDFTTGTFVIKVSIWTFTFPHNSFPNPIPAENTFPRNKIYIYIGF